MTTDRTQPARPAALNDRSSAAPAERRDASAFAALLDAHAPAPKREEASRDDVRPAEPRDVRQDQPRETRHDQPQQAAAGRDQPRDGGVSQDQPRDGAAHTPAPAVVPQAPAYEPAAQPEAAVPAHAQPVLPPFVATVPVEVPAPVAPATSPAPLFMLAPEAVAAPVAPSPVVPVEVATPVAAAAPVPAPTPTGTAQPVATPVVEPAPQQTTPAPAAAQPAAPQAPEGELPAAPVAAPVTEAPAAPEPHAVTPARAAVAPEPAPAAAPSVQAPAAEPVGPAPLSTPLSGPVVPERTVPLHRAPAAVSTLLHVAVDRGITHAKMALRPAELGGIEIRLQATAGGVAAQVVADSPEAARLLAQAGDDLRRALEARDVTLISLEVSTTADQRERQSARGEWSDARDSDPTSHGRAADDAEPAPTTQTVIELPGGLLVDVLA